MNFPSNGTILVFLLSIFYLCLAPFAWACLALALLAVPPGWRPGRALCGVALVQLGALALWAVSFPHPARLLAALGSPATAGLAVLPACLWPGARRERRTTLVRAAGVSAFLGLSAGLYLEAWRDKLDLPGPPPAVAVFVPDPLVHAATIAFVLFVVIALCAEYGEPLDGSETRPGES